MTPAEQVPFARRFGALEFELAPLSNVRDDGSLRPSGTGEYEEIEVGMVLPAIGYRGDPVPGVPYDERLGRVPNEDGRVVFLDWEAAEARGMPLWDLFYFLRSFAVG